MSDFPPDWLDLREGIDSRSRDVMLLRALEDRFASVRHVTVTDLGAGTASLLRALSSRLPA